MTPIRVLIVDDQLLFSEALGDRLRGEPDLEVVGLAADAGQARALSAARRPDVVLLDVMLGATNGVALVAGMVAENPAVRVVMVSGLAGIEDVVGAVRAGARAWLPKTAGGDELVRVVRGVVRGESWFPPDVLGELLTRLTRGDDGGAQPDRLTVLTSREREVLLCMVDGLGRATIADRLSVSPNTVRTHTQNLLTKLGVHSALEAVALALRAGVRPMDTSQQQPSRH